jgi:hypothetical protein
MKPRFFGMAAIVALLAITTSQTAFARSEADCKQQWASYGVDKSGHLQGKEMKVFYADMRGEGNVVEVPESNMLKAAETMKVCAADHREVLSQAHSK